MNSQNVKCSSKSRRARWRTRILHRWIAASRATSSSNRMAAGARIGRCSPRRLLAGAPPPSPTCRRPTAAATSKVSSHLRQGSSKKKQIPTLSASTNSTSPAGGGRALALQRRFPAVAAEQGGGRHLLGAARRNLAPRKVALLIPLILALLTVPCTPPFIQYSTAAAALTVSVLRQVPVRFAAHTEGGLYDASASQCCMFPA
jgi:hypothetical protein